MDNDAQELFWGQHITNNCKMYFSISYSIDLELDRGDFGHFYFLKHYVNGHRR